ncbi:MAG TPA: type II secretion system F family protein [Bryobacteraceae bacterium]|nr:type II secretion system F family protein [Bryobacteraceae bacterium]
MRTFWLILGACWIAFLACFWAGMRVFRSAQASRIRGRLLGQAVEKGSKAPAKTASLISAEDRRTGSLILRILARFELKPRLQVLLDQADLKWHPGRLMHACLALFLCAFAAVWYGAPVVGKLAIPVGLAAGSLPLVYALRRRTSRLRKFEEQFPESLEFVSRSMRAGHAFSVSLEMLHKEFQEPLAGEFRRTFDEHNLGMPLEAALQRLGGRVPLMDVQFFVSAVLLQKRTGGNLAELLDKLAYVIRERFKLRGRIRAVSAHGRMTGTALSLIPLSVAGMMFFTNREYVTFFFTDETGRMMAGLAAGLQLLGYGVIRKIVSIEV